MAQTETLVERTLESALLERLRSPEDVGTDIRGVIALDIEGWESEQGIHQRGSWRLRPVTAGTEVTLAVSFDLSGGPVGRLVEILAGRIVARNMWATLLAARRLLESDRVERTPRKLKKDA